MIIWSSLVAAILLFGGQGDAAPNHHRDLPQPTSILASSVASADAPAPTVTNPVGTFFQTNWEPIGNIALGQNAGFNYSVPATPDPSVGTPSLVLCQTNATGPEALTSLNTWTVTQITDPCVKNVNGVCTFSVGYPELVSVTFGPGSVGGDLNLNNFFLCFGTSSTRMINDLTCESYSPFFNINPAVGGAESGGPPAPNATPTSLIRLPQHTDVVGILGTASASTLSATFATYSSVIITVSATPTQAPSQTQSASAVPIAYKSKSLSTGALVGIIVGAVGGLVALALLALLCLRRRKHTGAPRSSTFDSNASATEHVLLTQPYHSVSSSRDLVNEKIFPLTLASIIETPLPRPVLPQNPRHSYDSLNASAPYSGLAAAPPKRKQASPPPPVTQHVQPPSQHLLSRELSDASGPLMRGLSDASGPISPRSTVRSEGREFEEYHDVPIYGDARHTPTVYQSHPSLQAPFLSEEGMSAEEIARLEDEERRIDAAIAAAEAEESGRRSR